MSEPQVSLFKGGLFALLGLALLAAMAINASSRMGFLQSALIADGAVVALNAGGSHPEIAFTDSTGARVSYPQGGLIFGYQVGQPVKVHYQANDPTGSAVVDDFGALWGTAALLGVLGAVFTATGLMTLFGRRP
ncbi:MULTISPECIES: DUF3592 domain-containing protein [Pseudomonadaceae]|jgi:hypothetical protein|uniref:DUF3592 domain-containing protein n=1 Tax=Metapseudomonas otitidis TaxID=319939 RepID=A0A1I0UAI9_9GAMM|nr:MULTISPECIES: DUF3592 domain-containing protein [Pseudomonas]MBO2928419.1 DUF3592 domain-containing protein [Pseudomonas otitidis]MDH1107996.1 DUF3592 domain-containing protein [Pseudomonas otitidis]MDH1158564.1 DUF3592 domain-containing protein [Pseudomonas otitidis]MDH1167011.1 DUF3592 domain-containing protein [Pseudomonas otitidis]MDU9395884.1 DUF3592 domain-containing protein [Pseudomonas sp. zfem003]